LQALVIKLDSEDKKEIVVTEGPLKITLLDGRSLSFPFSGATRLYDIQVYLQKQLGIEPDKQRLLLNTVELQEFSLLEQGVRAGCSLLLVILMLAVSNLRLKTLKFHLTWRFPRTAEGYTADYLDGSCLLYRGSTFIQEVDFENRESPGVTHSGDVMHSGGGKHTMDVNLSQLSAGATQLFFTLSAYRSPTLGSFGKPKVLLSNAENNNPLCEYQIHQVADSQAVIMCSLTLTTRGWEVVQVGMPCDGNVKDYNPILQTIESKIFKRTSKTPSKSNGQ
jgi:stress response protein SCP2